MSEEMIQPTGSLPDGLVRSPCQVVRGTMYSADFYPEDDDGNRPDGMLITIRVPVTTVVGPGEVVVQFLPRHGERKPEEPCSADGLNQPSKSESRSSLGEVRVSDAQEER